MIFYAEDDTNIRELVEFTGIKEVHGSGRGWEEEM